MRNIFAFILTISSFSAFGQTAEEHLQDGVTKHTEQDFKGAIKEYSKAIKVDKSFTDAYYNRGTCALALKDYKGAMTDFNKTLELDPEYVKAYYSRATVYASQGKYLAALPDLDKTIALVPSFPNALNLRGQIRAQSGNKKGACEDFVTAKNNGDQQAARYISQFCGNDQQEGESLILHWPESENWKIGSSHEDGSMAVMELIHANESLENWTEFGYMASLKGATNVAVDEAMNIMFEQSKQNAPKAKLTFIEKDENAAYPWILFMIEAPGFKNDMTPESQLWYIVQGKRALYANFRAVKEVNIPAELQEKWVAFFKTRQIVNK